MTGILFFCAKEGRDSSSHPLQQLSDFILQLLFINYLNNFINPKRPKKCSLIICWFIVWLAKVSGQIARRRESIERGEDRRIEWEQQFERSNEVKIRYEVHNDWALYDMNRETYIFLRFVYSYRTHFHIVLTIYSFERVFPQRVSIIQLSF